jgi:tetratricopeptide (TPR) repeat protein
MPKVIKKKPVKKKPVREDEVKSAAFQALEKIKERQKHVILSASLVAGVIILYLIFSLYTSSISNKAYSLEKEAYQYYYGDVADKSMTDTDRWQKALELYKKSLEVKLTPSALYYAGNCYYNLKDYDNAIKEYGRFADKFSSDKGILPLIYQKLAAAYFKTNQNDQALETLDRLSLVDGGIFKDSALILEAKYYESSGDKEKALEKYKELVSDFPFSPWSAEAGSKVSAEETKKAEASSDKSAEETNTTTEFLTPDSKKNGSEPGQVQETTDK